MGKVLLVAAATLAGFLLWHGHPAVPAPITWDRPLIAALTADLIDKDGTPAPRELLRDPKRVLVYFSASWCPPCRAFTPELVAYYNTHHGGSAFQLLFVSEDEGAGAMRGYMRGDAMPWWGVRYASPSAHALGKAYAGPGIPCLVLLDGQGHVLADSYVNGRYVGPQEVLKALDEGR
jgi:nucleoredoxin